MNNLQQPIITDQQRKALEVCFQKIKADYVQLAPYAIMARIINIEGKSAHDALKGYQLMRSIGVIPDSFVKGGPEIEQRIIKTYFHPVMCEMITRFGLEIEKFNLGYTNPKTGKSIKIETATAEEITQYTSDYREVNRVGVGDDTDTAHSARKRVRDLKLSLDDEEITIVRKTKETPAPPVQEIKRRITNTILNLDNDF